MKRSTIIPDHFYSWVAAETGQILVARIERADTPWKRAVGLMGRSALAPDAGLWIEPCNGIHTFFLRFPLDVVFLDRQHRVLRLVPRLPPWRFCGPCFGARTVVELPVGTIDRHSLRIGQRCLLVSSAAPRV